MNWTEEISKAFSASLGITKSSSSRDVVFDKDVLHLDKVAGLQIDDLTENGIEDFMRRYLLNELATAPVPLDVSISLSPLQYDKTAPNLIQDAQGVAQVTLNKQRIELPFLIQQKELLPFDVIQINGERCPFTRENLMKIINGIATKYDKGGNKLQQGETEDNPYESVEKPFNPSTVPGFMGTVMAIRDQHMSRRNPYSSVITAGENLLDSLLEKTANMKAITDEELEKIAEALSVQRKAEVINMLKKLAAEDEEFKKIEREENKKLRAEDKVKALFTSISNVKHGDIVAFEELIDDSLVPAKAIVLKNFKETPGIQNKKDSTVLLTQDGRIKILHAADDFKAIVVPEATFDLSSITTVEALGQDDVFMAIDGDDVIFPYVVNRAYKEYNGDEDSINLIYGRQIEGAATREMIARDPKFEILDLEKSYNAYIYSDSIKKQETSLRGIFGNDTVLFTLPNAKFNRLTPSEFIKRKEEETQINPKTLTEKYIDRFNRYNEKEKGIFCTDRKTSVIRITGAIKNSISSVEDARYIMHKDASTINEIGIEKFAKLTQNFIEIQCIDRSLKKYNVSIFFKDDTKRFFGDTKKGFNNISEGKLKAILRILKYDPREANRIIYKCKNEPKVNEVLKPGVTSQDIFLVEGATSTINLTKRDVQRTFNRLVQPEQVVTNLATTIATGLIVDGVKASLRGNGKAGQGAEYVYKMVKKMANESEILSDKLEKIAKEYKNDEILNLAKAMAISHYFNEKVASTITEEEICPLIKDVSKEIIETDVFSKIAGDISSLRISQVENNNEIIPAVYLKGMMNQLDGLYKVAYAVNSVKVPKEINLFEKY